MAQDDYYAQAPCSLPDDPRLHRLAEELGVDDLKALGILIAVFCRARRHVPDGNLAATPERTLAGWTGFRRLTFAALTKSGWVDKERRLDDWEVRYRQCNEAIERERDRRAANQKAYRDRKREQENRSRVTEKPITRDRSRVIEKIEGDRPKDKEHKGKEQNQEQEHTLVAVASGAATHTPPDVATELLLAWNGIAVELFLPKAERLNDKRRSGARLRVEEGLLARWPEFAAALRASAFHRGGGPRGWRADFDWLVTPGRWLRLVEEHSAPPAAPPPVESAAQRNARLEADRVFGAGEAALVPAGGST